MTVAAGVAQTASASAAVVVQTGSAAAVVVVSYGAEIDAFLHS